MPKVSPRLTSKHDRKAIHPSMTVRQFYDWQTAGGSGDVSLLVETLERRASKRQKDLLDIMRLVEAHPKLRKLLPADLAKKIKG